MRISIPKPCHEDWNQMTPNEQGRFCLSCQKTVVDFTNMTKTEISDYFKIMVNENICGRIKKSDLSEDVVLPEVVIYPSRFFITPKYTPSRMFVITVGMVFLYSCNGSPMSRDVRINEKEQIDTSSIIPMTPSHDDSVLLGEIAAVETESVGKPIKGKIVDDSHLVNVPLPDLNQKPKPTEPIGQQILMGDIVEIEPEFPGGDEALLKFVKDIINYDTTTMIAGKVFVRFVVEADGSVKNVSIARGLSPANDAEAIRVVSMLPNFKPGYEGGKTRKTPMVIPIVFK
jgi:TonB family protein